MLNLCVNAGKSCFRSKFLAIYFCNRLQLYSSFTIKDVLFSSSGDTGSLINRFAKHIAINNSNFYPLTPTTIRYADFFPIHDVRHFQKEVQKIPNNQISQLIIFASTYRSNGDPLKFVRVLNELDRISAHEISQMDYYTVLQTLYAFLFLIPNKITRTEFYKKAAPRLVQNFSNDMSKEVFVQVCFYLGLSKKNMAPNCSNLLTNFLENYFKVYTPQLSTMDMGLVTSAIFKTAIKVNCEEYLDRLQQETLSSQSDDALLITFIKNLRLQQIKSDKICENLKSLCVPHNLKKLHTMGLAHILAYLAENKWDDESYINHIRNEFIFRIIEIYEHNKYDMNIRAKDLAMFLWSCAQLNLCFSETDLKLLEFVVLSKVENNEYTKFPDQLVDSCLSLWMLGMKSRNIFDKACSHVERYKLNFNSQSQRKVDNRFVVLKSAAKIENPIWMPSTKCFEEKAPAPEYLLKNRHDITQYFEKLITEDDIESVLMVSPIKGINIPGILVQFKNSTEKVYVELIENEQLLRFSQEATAILKLKINLLTTLGYRVFCLRQQDFPEKYTFLKNIVDNNEISVKTKSH